MRDLAIGLSFLRRFEVLIQARQLLVQSLHFLLAEQKAVVDGGGFVRDALPYQLDAYERRVHGVLGELDFQLPLSEVVDQHPRVEMDVIRVRRRRLDGCRSQVDVARGVHVIVPRLGLHFGQVLALGQADPGLGAPDRGFGLENERLVGRGFRDRLFEGDEHRRLGGLCGRGFTALSLLRTDRPTREDEGREDHTDASEIHPVTSIV